MEDDMKLVLSVELLWMSWKFRTIGSWIRSRHLQEHIIAMFACYKYPNSIGESEFTLPDGIWNTTGIRDSFDGSKTDGAWSLQLTSFLCWGSVCVELNLHSPTWRSA